MSITGPKSRGSKSIYHQKNPNPNANTPQPPLVVTLSCIEDNELEQDSLAGVAAVEHVSLNRLADGKIESAAAVLLHSLAFLPRAAQRRLKPWQLILCLGSYDRAVDSALAVDLGLRLVHVDVSRAEEVADTVMALMLGLLRRTHLLSRRSLSSSGWLGSVQPVCGGMRRCRGLVLGITGRSASGRSLATRSLSFKMNVLYFDTPQGQECRSTITSPPAARRMETLNDLLAASDVISLHCALTDETVQILNAECLQHIKPGAYLVNTGSSQLLDDCAVKKLLIDGTIAGCALDGAEGPQWMEAWVREIPNVLVLPRSADYSEEVWMEIREKAISILQMYFLDGAVPSNAVSDEEDEESEITYENEQFDRQDKEKALHSAVEQLPAESPTVSASFQGKGPIATSVCQPGSGVRFVPKSRKKAKKRHGRQKSQNKPEDIVEKESASQQDDDTAMSGTEQSSGSRCASPGDSRRRKILIELSQESSASLLQKSGKSVSKKSGEQLKDGCVIALHAKEHSTLYVSRQRVKGGGWFLDTMSGVTKRDPAAQFLVVFGSKDTIGLRSLAAGGKLLQIIRKMEFVFASHNFDVWESWSLEGPLEECRLVNCRNTQASLDVRVEVLATLGQDDGVLRWLD
ncbi:LOW QUALITY PROTEIN: hypothetical protein Cgig2_002332 [Carnegiea gigantea]|uniref:D-isomer specific 2-hydroxyacid dehydrogenase NAD-binding domain-containing protein n=1 Tax=Carnegiea gigantea TaxID=171969 RepID=A0A9Q1JYA7_9CARY|nr:LOW QUALITY PROTEIN: hypothetical protein Cgig2_002332 [Carnegiea gigantea]